MHELKPSRTQIIAFYGMAVIFVIVSGFAIGQADFKAAAGFAALAFSIAAYGLYKSRSGIAFNASEPRLTIRNGFSAAITVNASDVVRCDLTKSNSRTDKLTYRVGQQTKSLVPYGDEYESLVAWARFCETYLDAVQSEEARADHRKLIQSDADPGTPQ